MPIQSFLDPDTESAFKNGLPSKLGRRCPWKPQLKVVCRKLDMLNAAVEIMDLRAPPSNRLEMLEGNLSGLYSIRVNNRWRIVFQWTEEGAEDVRVMDYH